MLSSLGTTISIAGMRMNSHFHIPLPEQQLQSLHSGKWMVSVHGLGEVLFLDMSIDLCRDQ